MNIPSSAVTERARAVDEGRAAGSAGGDADEGDGAGLGFGARTGSDVGKVVHAFTFSKIS